MSTTTSLRTTLPATPEPAQVAVQDPNDSQQVAAGVGLTPDGSVVVVSSESPSAIDAPEDFDAAAGVTAPVPVKANNPAPTTALAAAPGPAQRSATALALEEMSDGAVSGDWESSDMRTPRIALVNGNGELSRVFHQGTLVLNETEILPTPKLQGAPDPKHFLRFTPILMEKSFQERTDDAAYKAGIRPLTARTVDEVTALGGTLRKINGVPATWQPVARCVLLLEQNEFSAENAHYALSIGDKQYCLVTYYSKGWSWSSFASVLYSNIPTLLTEPVIVDGKPLRDELTGRLEKKIVLHRYWWKWTTEKSKGDHPQFIPKITVSRDLTGPDVREFIEQLGLTGR